MRTNHPFSLSTASVVKAPPARKWPRLLRRGPMENLATILILSGVGMLMQPFFLALFSYSFITILVGTGIFMVGSHFPE